MDAYAPRQGTVISLRRMHALLTVSALLLHPVCLLQAGEIYKSFDANGNVVYSDHADPAMRQSLVHLEDPRYPPHEIHICWTNCFTLTLDSGVYRRLDGTDETWSIETFTADAVALHRHSAPADWNEFSTDVRYAGRAAHDRLLAVTVNGKPVSGVDASWGIALNTLPGSNAERDAQAPSVPSARRAPPMQAGNPATVSAAVPPPPPPLLEESPSVAPQDGDLWTAGYWYWRGQQGYAWVPGAWVRRPRAGVPIKMTPNTPPAEPRSTPPPPKNAGNTAPKVKRVSSEQVAPKP